MVLCGKLYIPSYSVVTRALTADCQLNLAVMTQNLDVVWHFLVRNPLSSFPVI